MTAALIAVSLALAAAVGGLLAFGLASISATRGEGKATARADVADKSIEVLQANLATMTAARDAEKERGDALDAALARAAAAAVGPVDGAFSRLLREVAAARAARGAGAAAVRDAGVAGAPAAAAGGDPRDLLKPGE